MRISPAVASNRIKELEKHLGVRLFNRTTRQLMPTEHGRVFYEGAKQVIEAVAEAEAAVTALSGQPRGTIRVTAPLGLGRRLIASGIPEFRDRYPDIEVRLGSPTIMSISCARASTSRFGWACWRTRASACGA